MTNNLNTTPAMITSSARQDLRIPASSSKAKALKAELVIATNKLLALTNQDIDAMTDFRLAARQNIIEATQARIHKIQQELVKLEEEQVAREERGRQVLSR